MATHRSTLIFATVFLTCARALFAQDAPPAHVAFADSGATIERDGSESEAWLKLPPDSLASHLDQLIVDRAAEFDYRIKQQTHRPEPTEPVHDGADDGAPARAES